MGQSIRTIILVTVVTALVWIFAEAESLRSQETTIQLVFESERGADRVIDLVDPATPPGAAPVFLPPATVLSLTVQIEGSTGAIDTTVRRLRERSIKLAPGAEGVPSTVGENILTLRDVLRALPELRSQGVAIKKVEPETVRIFVDELAWKEVKVAVSTPDGNLDGPPESKPTLVRVVAPQRDVRRLSEESVASVRVEKAVWDKLVPGRRESLPGRIVEPPQELAGLPRVQLVPSTVDVSLTVRSKTSTIVLATVPVHLRLPPAELSKFDVDILEEDRALINVSVTGPTDIIRELESKTLRPVAYVSLSFEELERGTTAKEAVFSDLPLTLGLRFEVANRNVRLKITRREPPVSGTSPARPNGP